MGCVCVCESREQRKQGGAHAAARQSGGAAAPFFTHTLRRARAAPVSARTLKGSMGKRFATAPSTTLRRAGGDA